MEVTGQSLAHFKAWERTAGPFEYMKTNIHVQSYKTVTCKNSVINMDTKPCNNMSGYVKLMENYNAFKKELK